MYKSIITLKSDLSPEIIQQIHEICNQAHDNYCGKVVNKSSDPLLLHFEDTGNPYAILGLGYLAIIQHPILHYFKSWAFIDEIEPNESCDMLASYYRRHPKVNLHQHNFQGNTSWTTQENM